MTGNTLYAAALEIQDACRAAELRFCFIGGIAVLRWSNPRQTLDVDVAVFTGWEDGGAVIDALLGRFEARLPGAREFAERHRVLLLRSSAGVPIDVSLAALQFEDAMIGRATDFQFSPGVLLRTCSAEDLLVTKCFAGREKDWMDVEGVLERHGPGLNLGAVRRELAELAEVTGDSTRLEEFLRRAGRKGWAV
ncbi:MAG: hypothetical protein SF028_11575 [Candidatus Sumerlaeia bacterium]|nr:hypothetical protein [Candidatus Sumerlaeia bacterium]